MAIIGTAIAHHYGESKTSVSLSGHGIITDNLALLGMEDAVVTMNQGQAQFVELSGGMQIERSDVVTIKPNQLLPVQVSHFSLDTTALFFYLPEIINNCEPMELTSIRSDQFAYLPD